MDPTKPNGEEEPRNPGSARERILPRGGESLIVIPLPKDFNIYDAFQSESRPSTPTASLEPTNVPSATAVSPEAHLDPPQDPADEDASVVPLSVADPIENVPSSKTFSLEARHTPPRDSTAEDASVASVSVADLIESEVPLEWREVVAIAQRLCRVIAHDPAASVQHSLLEPRNVEISDNGKVRVLPGGPGSDPLVQQIGRILRALLQGCNAPAGLRLLALQASFEVPLYGSVDELSLALHAFESAEDGDDVIRSAFRRAIEARRAFAVERRLQEAASAQSVVLPVPALTSASATPAGPEHPWRLQRSHLLALSAVAMLGLALVLLVSVARGTGSGSGQTPVPLGGGSRALSIQALPGARALAARSLAPPPALPHVVPSVTESLVPKLTIDATTATSKPAPARKTNVAAVQARRGPAIESGPIVFDEPRDLAYRPDSPGSTPEALETNRAINRLSLLALAERAYHDARAAFAAGDFDRAIAEGAKASTILEDPDIGLTSAEMVAAVQQLLALASAAKSRDEARVYAASDQEVTPPRPLGRQLPLGSPAGVPSHMVGRLEMFISREGDVDSVKLHTPLNRYHERMIVSAAKAWRYSPALKSGKPVRFNLVIVINLPESPGPQ